MAVNTKHLNSKLKVQFKTEPDMNNKQTTKTLNNAGPEADSEALYEIALKMGKLQKHALSGVYRQEEYELSEK